MEDREKTKAQLLEELEHLRRRVAALERGSPCGAGPLSLDGSNDGVIEGLVYLCNSDRIVEFAAGKLLEHMGIPVKGEKCHRTFFGLDQVCPWCKADRVFGGETLQHQVVNPVDHRLYDVVFVPVSHPDGSRSIMGLMRDITDNKRVERALRHSQDRLQLAWDTTPDAFSISRLDDGTYIDVNQGYTALTGYSREEVIGRSAVDIPFWHDPADRAVVVERILQEGFVNNFEARIRRKDGGVRNVLISAALMDMEGEPHLLALTKDIDDLKRAHEQLKLAEERYRTLVEESFDGVLVQKRDVIVFANRRLHEMLGYQDGELIGKKHWEVYAPESRGITRSRAEARLRGEFPPPRYEVKVQRKNGTTFDAELNAKAVTLEGEPGIQVWIRDITEEKRSRMAIEKSEERYRQLAEHSLTGIFIQQDGIVRYANRRLAEMYGCEPEQIIGKHVAELVHPDDWDWLKKIDLDQLKGNSPLHQYELRALDNSDQTRWVEIRAAIIDFQGRPATMANVLDITERRQADAERRRLTTAIEQAAESIIITDRNGVIEYVNPAFEAATGYSRDEAVGKTPEMLRSDCDDDQIFEKIRETLRKGSVWRGALTNRRKDGTLAEVAATVSCVRDENGKVVNCVTVQRDITTERMLEKQLLHAQKMEAVGELAGGVAHDFNNLLTIILGYSDMLIRERGPGHRAYEALKQIVQAAREGRDLVKRMLTFSRKIEPAFRPLDLNREIRRIHKLLKRTIPRMIETRLVLANDLSIINADPGQMEQILLNLVVNAQHAMPEGGEIVIETRNVYLSEQYCKTHLQAKPGQFVVLSVSDTGQGIEKEIQHRIFEPFFTTKQEGQGTGLGLSMVHGIVAQHGGFIRCYSEPGVGTTFKIYFPADPGETVSEETLPSEEGLPFGTETILLVEDEERIRELGAELLGFGGYNVLTAADGAEALEIYRERGDEIALVILDLIMPRMSGTQCLEALLAMDPRCKILVASGYAPNGPMRALVEAGAKGAIDKPFDMKEMLQTVRRIIDDD